MLGGTHPAFFLSLATDASKVVEAHLGLLRCSAVVQNPPTLSACQNEKLICQTIHAAITDTNNHARFQHTALTMSCQSKPTASDYRFFTLTMVPPAILLRSGGRGRVPLRPNSPRARLTKPSPNCFSNRLKIDLRPDGRVSNALEV